MGRVMSSERDRESEWQERESGSERCDGERVKTEMKQMGRSGTGGELGMAPYLKVREFTVNHWAVISGSSYSVALQSQLEPADTLKPGCPFDTQLFY